MRKFKCIKSYESGEWLTKGKIYTVHNNKFKYDDGYMEKLFSLSDVGFNCNRMSDYLVEIKNEKEEVKMDKFKVGDVVKIICNSCGHCFNVGDIVELYEDCGGNFRGRTSKNEYKANHILEDDMEKFIKPTLDNDTMIEKLKKHCSISSCEDCVLCDEWCEFEDPDTDELEYLYNLAFGNDQSNLANNSESTPKYDLKKDKIAVLCDTDKKLTELYKLFNSKPNTSVALVCNPSKLYVSWDSESNELTWDSVEYHEINHYTLLTFEEFMNGFVAKNPITFTITTSDTTTTLTDGTHITTINRYYTDKHDDMVALEEVVKKYKSEIEDVDRVNKIPKVGDKVRVIDSDATYPTYYKWFFENKINDECAMKWQYDRCPNEREGTFRVVSLGKHNIYDDMIALITDDNHTYLINIEGLEVVK